MFLWLSAQVNKLSFSTVLIRGSRAFPGCEYTHSDVQLFQRLHVVLCRPTLHIKDIKREPSPIALWLPDPSSSCKCSTDFYYKLSEIL